MESLSLQLLISLALSFSMLIKGHGMSPFAIPYNRCLSKTVKMLSFQNAKLTPLNLLMWLSSFALNKGILCISVKRREELLLWDHNLLTLDKGFLTKNYNYQIYYRCVREKTNTSISDPQWKKTKSERKIEDRGDDRTNISRRSKNVHKLLRNQKGRKALGFTKKQHICVHSRDMFVEIGSFCRYERTFTTTW